MCPDPHDLDRKGGDATSQSNSDQEEIVTPPVEDFLDLHTFQAREVNELLDDYLKVARENGFKEVLIIHGKGTGVLRQRVHTILKKHPMVLSFRQADPLHGGWGATVVVLCAGTDG